MIEKFMRPTGGKLEGDITVMDPKACTTPWGAHETMDFLPDSELIEHVCEGNNEFRERIGLEPTQ